VKYGGGAYFNGKIIIVRRASCTVYAIDTCSQGTYRRQLSRGIECSSVENYMNDPLGTLRLYHHFNRKPSKYYPDGVFQKFVTKYQNNPINHIIILSTFTGFFFVNFVAASLMLCFKPYHTKTKS
jgi:hypothetical protein